MFNFIYVCSRILTRLLYTSICGKRTIGSKSYHPIESKRISELLFVCNLFNYFDSRGESKKTSVKAGVFVRNDFG